MKTLIDRKKLIHSISVVNCVVAEKRMLILQLLMDYGEMQVNELVSLSKIDQPQVSFHLQHLFNTGYLKRRQAGKNVYYSANLPRVKMLVDVAERLG
jgi:DNA-binding transcriptional ArsR family regulator